MATSRQANRALRFYVDYRARKRVHLRNCETGRPGRVLGGDCGDMRLLRRTIPTVVRRA
jgi:hypothetical protein